MSYEVFITDKGLKAISGGKIIMGNDKLDRFDESILRILSDGPAFESELEWISSDYKSHVDRLVKLKMVERI